MAARASSAGEPAALAWLVLLPDPLTASAFVGTLALLAVFVLTGHRPGHLGRTAIAL